MPSLTVGGLAIMVADRASCKNFQMQPGFFFSPLKQKNKKKEYHPFFGRIPV